VPDEERKVAELAAACVRFVSTRYAVMPDFTPDTLSLIDQWLRDASPEVKERPESEPLVVGAAGAYFGEVVRTHFGGAWRIPDLEDPSVWRICLSEVYCAFNPLAMAREALWLEPSEGWHAHLELDPAEREAIEARLAALPKVPDEEYYAPTTRFDVLSMVVDALREGMRARGMADVRFTPEDYDE
jgi:hypothetical protein